MSLKGPDISLRPDIYQTEMPMLTHKFKEFFFHHEKPDVLVCLEFNKYPTDLESYHLEAIQAEKKVKAFKSKIEHDAIPAFQRSDTQIGAKKNLPTDKRKSGLIPMLQAQGSSPKKKFVLLAKGAENANVDSQADIANEERDLIDFEHQANMLKQKLAKKDAEYEIGVSFWQIGSQNPTQILEQRFQGKSILFFLGENPFNMKFSTDGKYIFVIYDRRKLNPDYKPQEAKQIVPEKDKDDKNVILTEDSVIHAGRESEQDYNKQIIGQVAEPEVEDADKWIMDKYIAIMTSDTLNITYNGPLGNDLQQIPRADLIWESKYLYVNNPQEPMGQHTFYKVRHNEPETETMDTACFTLSVDFTEEMPGLEAKDMLFTEKHQKKIFTFQIMANMTAEMKNKNEFEARLIQYDLQDNRRTTTQQGTKTFSILLKNVPSFSQVHANKSFNTFFVVDDDDYSAAYSIRKNKDKKGEWQAILLEQTHNEIQKNPFLYEEFYGICKDQEGFRQIADHKTEEQKQIESGLKGTTSTSFDIQYSESKQAILEVVEAQGGHLLICTYKKHGTKLTPNIQRLREISGFSLNFPYLSCCKGNSELIIRNFHYTREQIVVPLPRSQVFISFVELQDHSVFSDPIKEVPFYDETPQKLMKEADRKKYQQMKKLDSVDICYMTLNLENQYEIQLIRLFPYTPKQFFIAEQWTCKQRINAQTLSAKEICQAHIFTLPFQRLTGKRDCSTILLQTKEQLAVKMLTAESASPITVPCNSQIRAVYSKISGQREYFFVSDDKHGSEIKILSQNDNSADQVATVYDDQNNKIVAMVKRGKYIFVLDENYLMRQLEIICKDKEKSKLEQVCVLECSPKTRDQLIKHKDKLFTRFHRIQMSSQHALHVNGHFFRFFSDSLKLMQSIAEEELYQIDSFISEKQNRKYLEGPFNVSDSKDNLAYFFEDSSLQGICVFRNCIDSKLNFLANVSCSFASFLPQDKLGYEEILVGIRGQFFIFMPNGEIQQEVEFFDPSIIDVPELKVEDVSDTLEYFVFQGIEKVYKLRKGDRCFEAKTSFFRVPQEREDETLRRNRTIHGAVQMRYGKVNPQPLNDRSGQIKQNEEDSYEHEEVIDGEAEDTDKNIHDSDLKTYESREYRYINGSMQVGDEGSIWNLYYDTENQKVHLRVNSKTQPVQYVPMRLQGDVVSYVKTNSKIPKVKMVLVEHYLVMAVMTQFMPNIYYLQVEQQPLRIVSQLPMKISLHLTNEWEFIDLKNVNADNRVQIQLYNKVSNTTSLITWNLKKNLEDRSLEILDKLDSVSKGVKSTLNYCNLVGVSYDLEYGFPLTFFGDISSLQMRRNFFEAAFSEGKDMIVVRDKDSLGVSLTMSMLELRFLMRFDQMRFKLRKKSFPFSLVNFRTPEGDNIFHFLIKDFKVLKRFQYSYMKFIEQFEDADDKKKYLELFLLILYPNNNEVSPFDIAMKESSQFVDLFLVMLTEVPDYPLSRFIFKELVVFKQLLNMGLKSFETFLDRCRYQNYTMNKTFVRYWKHGEATCHIFQANSSLITNSFLRKNIGKHEDDPEESKGKETRPNDTEALANGKLDLETLRKTKMNKLECKLRKDMSNQIDRMEQRFGGEKKRIDISMVEFDWVFQGDEGEMFVEELAKCQDDDIFKVETIKICILFLWDFYFYRILLAVFIPYFIFFCLFFTYSTFVTDGEMTLADYILAIICTAYSVYALCMESRQIYVQGWEYFSAASITWNFIDIASTVCSLISTVNDLGNFSDPASQRNVMSLAIFFLWLKFFYFLRIFQPTSAFIRMITEIIKDMGIFSLIYLLANISVANALFVLDGSLNSKAVEVTTYDGYLGTMASVYLNGLGDFSTDNFKGHPNEGLVWTYFFILTVLITLVLLNLLIAIMGDTFDRVQEMKEEAMLKELCSLISDNWFWLNQKQKFAKTKYICVAKLEQADSVGSGGWEGKLATLKTFFQSSMQNLEMSLKQVKQMQKDDIQNLQKTLSNQVNFVQQGFNKRSDQLEKQNKRLQEMIAKMMAKQTNTEPEVVESFIEEEKIAGDENMADISMDSTQKKRPDYNQKSANNNRKRFETAIVEDYEEEENKEEDDFN